MSDHKEVCDAARALLVATAGGHDTDCDGECFTDPTDTPCETMALYVRLDRALVVIDRETK